MCTLIIAFNDNKVQELEFNEGVILSIPWDSLKETIANGVRLREDEIIEGLVVNEVDIRVKISRKKGRKKINS